MNQNVPGRARLHAFARRAGGHDAAHHGFHLVAELFHAGYGEHIHLGRVFLDFHLYLVVVEVPQPPQIAQLFAGGLAAALGAGPGQQKIKQAFLGLGFGFGAHAFVFLVAHQFDAQVQQIADHGFHVAAHIAHFGIFGGFHLDEGRAGQFGQPPGYFGLAHAGGAHEDNVLGRYLVAQGRIEALAPPAVAHRHGHHTLGLVLAYDVFVKLGHNLAGRECAHGRILYGLFRGRRRFDGRQGRGNPHGLDSRGRRSPRRWGGEPRPLVL